MIKILKGSSARKMFVKHPELKQKLWGSHLWNTSYFVATVKRTVKRIHSKSKNKIKIEDTMANYVLTLSFVKRVIKQGLNFLKIIVQ